MIRQLAFTLALAAAGPASALSCLAPSVEGTYRQAAESAEDFVIGVGSLSLAGPSDPPEGAVAQGGDINAMVGYTQPATFEGTFFTGSDFSNSRTVPVTVDVTCVAAWCGAASDVEYGLFFFRLDDGAYTLTENACPGFSFSDAHPGMLEEVISCHQGSCNGAW
ncbi:hypothetical protein [Gymnodinialimonas ceratoperidinii]|uniref:Uncharacterized protein n=1 Tax=Gymnodinialimonas ceratoperidinii TaxID=2856823 RepID=A0A8F6TY47_9RHOB|nr:hypothetical protein [Gymnodinialimonas ceratoperidinii]QXT39842.1 hypothetical protein KYE46_00845 [Gymnodinialimonas ceratoperidinii]